MEFLHNAGHEKFNFKSLLELKEKLNELGMELPLAEDYSLLGKPISLSDFKIPNSLAVQPMEGCDANANGGPGDLTIRRYRRFGAGGSGLLWMEATAVVEEGKANPRQLHLTPEAVIDFQRLRQQSLQAAASSMGEEHKPLLVVQLTHSGRYARPGSQPAPIITQHAPMLDAKHDLSNDYPLISDEELDQLQSRYVEAAGLAREAGYNAVDVKACHGYLVNELLGAHTRENSKYGGSFANRTRFLVEVVKKIKQKYPDLIVCTRLNVYDAIPYPYGFGMKEDGSLKPDMTEPVKLIKLLSEEGVELVNVAIANPYYTPHVERPYDTPTASGYYPEEHPLENICENMKITREITEQTPDEIVTVASGLSWLREYIPQVAAGLKAETWSDIIGLGRTFFAYPDFTKDLLQKGAIDQNKLCISCSSCTQIMRDGGRAGCPVRDSEIYAPIYKAGRMRNQEYMTELAQNCRDCTPATCVSGCPAGVDIPEFIQAIARQEDQKAYHILREKNNLPEVCAYTCPVEAQCESECVQNNIGQGPVPIQALQRYVSEKARKQEWAGINIPDHIIDKRVAIVGGGPAGLAAATDLLEKGYQVTIFDAGQEPGGMARDVIPEKRLRQNVLRQEINAILKQVPDTRLCWEFGKSLGDNISFNKLEEEFDAIFLAVGLQESYQLKGDTRPEQVYDALEFLQKVKRDKDFILPSRIAVIGGGNTAMDAAVQAAVNQSDDGDVYLLYRRSFAQMPAWPGEREQALQAGVHFLVLQQPQSYITDESGSVSGIKIVRTELGEKDESGRRRPEIVPGTEQVLQVDMVIEAIGQKLPDSIKELLIDSGIELEGGLIVTCSDNHMTNKSKVFAGGDIINGGMTVVQAVSDGSQVAAEIDEFFRSKGD